MAKIRMGKEMYFWNQMLIYKKDLLFFLPLDWFYYSYTVFYSSYIQTQVIFVWKSFNGHVLQ